MNPHEDDHTQLNPSDLTGSNDATRLGRSEPLPCSLEHPKNALEAGGRIAEYRLVRLLGQGGMGMVHEAEDEKLGRRVALKLMRAEISDDAVVRQRFLREARTAARVESDHVCAILQVGEANGIPFIVMPMLKGEPLNARLEREAKLPMAEVVRIGREVALGLSAAHEVGLVHRDVKPGNIWIEALNGRVKILDFGLARGGGEAQLTRTDAFVGTPAYVAPEQARGLRVDGRADLFSLGVMLYEMTTSERPFKGSDFMSILTSLAVDAPAEPRSLRADVPEALNALIVHLLQKSPENRPASAAEVARRLEQMQATKDTATMPILPSPASGRLFRWLGYLAAGLLLILVALLVSKVYFDSPQGTLVIDVDGDAEAQLARGELRIYADDGTLKHALKRGETKKELPPGKYRVKFEGAVGLKLDAEMIEIEKHGKVVVRIKAEPKLPEKTLAQIDRDAAEWVVSLGGVAIVQIGEREHEAKAKKELPQETLRLREAKLGNTKVTDEGLSRLKDCVGLRAVELGNTEVSDAGMVHLKGLKQLEALVLTGPNISDAGVAHLTALRDLKFLLLSDTKVTDDGLALFGQCKHLDQLDLYNTKVTDKGLAAFADCENLREVNLRHTLVTGTGLAKWKCLPRITQFDFTDSKVTDAGLAFLKQCKNLELLNFQENAVTDTVLAHLSGCPNLQNLTLSGTHLTGQGLGGLKECRNLVAIFLDGTKLTDVGLATLPELPNLKTLSLGDTAIGDDSVKTLSRFTSLETLNIARSKFTPEGFAALRKALPKCKVE